MKLDLEPAGAPDESMSPDGRPTPPPRLSPSGASTFEQCPRRWRFRYVDRLPDPPGVAALAGSFAHLVLELLLQADSADRTKDRARILARELWPEFESRSDFHVLELDEIRRREFRWRAWTAVEGLWTLEDPAQVHVLATEQNVEATLAGVPFRGIVDRLDQAPDGVVVTDYKSGRAPRRRYEQARLAQVLLYAAAVAESTSERPVRARLLYLGQKPVEVDVTEVALAGAVDSLAATWSAIGESCTTDSFEPRVGPLCGWCPFVDRCPSGQSEAQRRGASRLAEPAAVVTLAG